MFKLFCFSLITLLFYFFVKNALSVIRVCIYATFIQVSYIWIRNHFPRCLQKKLLKRCRSWIRKRWKQRRLSMTSFLSPLSEISKWKRSQKYPWVLHLQITCSLQGVCWKFWLCDHILWRYCWIQWSHKWLHCNWGDIPGCTDHGMWYFSWSTSWTISTAIWTPVLTNSRWIQPCRHRVTYHQFVPFRFTMCTLWRMSSWSCLECQRETVSIPLWQSSLNLTLPIFFKVTGTSLRSPPWHLIFWLDLSSSRFLTAQMPSWT